MEIYKRFNKFEDETIIRMRKDKQTFKTIGKAVGRRESSCYRRCKILIAEKAERKAALELAKYKKEQAELFPPDERDPLWIIAMKGREFEDAFIPQAMKPVDNSIPWR